MALCSFSSSLVSNGYTQLDNVFFTEFLPSAPEIALKVYLMGRYLCSVGDTDDNSIQTMCASLNIKEDELISNFNYWQSLGLVQIVSTNPLEVKFLPVKQFSGSSKLRIKDKYEDFNKRAQELLPARLISPNEYNEYYTLIETYHFEPEAVLMIIKYCTCLKGDGVNYPYILAVARSFEVENIKTATALEAKLLEQEKASDELKSILTTLSIKRSADIDERNLYLKWTNGYGFTHGVILHVAKKQSHGGGMHKLDETLTKYYELKLFTIKEIENYGALRDNMFAIAKDVTRNIGQYYQVLDSVVENYVSNWVQKGFSAEMLSQISKYCFTMNYKTLDLVDDTINKFFKLGLITETAISQYIGSIIAENASIKEILETLGLVRNVNSYDRELYKTWTEVWGYKKSAIMLIANEAKTKEYPLSYINRILSDMNSKGIKTDEEISKNLAQKEQKTNNKPTQTAQIPQRDYTKQDLSALFDSLDDVEI
ncbi:MAG: DnaD domain protein [Clostridia bacterium]|nr:DnaD domain protein [Clostridia bacterium]